MFFLSGCLKTGFTVYSAKWKTPSIQKRLKVTLQYVYYRYAISKYCTMDIILLLCYNIGTTHVFYALTLAGSRGCCLNTGPIG